MTRENFADFLTSEGFEVRPNGIWLSVGTPVRDYGWKLHLSSVQVQALDLLAAVAPILLRSRVPFKVALDREVLGELNEGTFGITQLGKFATLYPVDDVDAVKLAKELVAVSSGFSGPRIITDLSLGTVVYTRFGPFNPKWDRDRLGNFTASASMSSMALADYSVPFKPPPGIPNPFDSLQSGTLRPSEAEPEQNTLPGYLKVQTLSVHPKGSVLLAMDIRSQSDVRLVVLKQGRRYCMSDANGRDIWDRLQHQYELARELSGKVRVPGAFDLFDHGEYRYLAIQFISGRNFSERSAVPFASRPSGDQRQLIEDFIALSDTLAALHNEGIVHRDLSPRNVRVDDKGSVWLVDLEMADRIGAKNSLFMQGTPGFISPQQYDGISADYTDDLYSFGCLLVNAITGTDPRRLSMVPDDRFAERIRLLSGSPPRLVQLCRALLDQDPRQRPPLTEVREKLQQCSASIPSAVVRVSADTSYKNWRPVLRGAVDWMISGCMRDAFTGMPLSPELGSIHHEASLSMPQAYKLYRSASRGVSGVLYCIARMARLGVDVADNRKFAEKAADWLLQHHATDDDQLPGLHFGEAGVAIALVEAVEAGLIEAGAWLRPYLKEVFDGPLDWPDLTHGAAGQGLAALQVAYVTRSREIYRFADDCAKYLLSQQSPAGNWTWPSGVAGMEGTNYTGLAHGTAGVVYFLSAHARVTGSHLSHAAMERGLSWLADEAVQGSKGLSHWWPREAGGEDAWHWWCHGGPGIAVALLACYQATGSEQAAELARSALSVHPLDVRTPNLSQCHGLAGLGETYLEAWRILGDDKWYERARVVARTLFAMQKEEGGRIHWLVENPFHPTADLMIGVGGVLHFLSRFYLDDRAMFALPLMPEPRAIENASSRKVVHL